MYHNMVLSYDYTKQKRQRRQMNASPSKAILMTMWRRWSNKCGIAQCSMSRATLEATGCRHRATTHSISPWRPPGRQQETMQICNMYPLWWSFQWPSQCGGTTVCIARWRRSRAFVKATKCRHRATTRYSGHCNHAAMWLDVWGAMAIL
jgi:hypothetical protein